MFASHSQAEQKARGTFSLYRQLATKTGFTSDSDSNWLITLSDVLTLLLIFFIFFFLTTGKTGSLKQMKIQSPTGPAPALAGAQQQVVQNSLSNEMADMVRDLKMEDGVSVMASKEEVIITLKEKITFRPGEAELLKTSEPALDKIGEMLNRYPSFIVEIDGHTDNQPINTRLYPSNWELSVDRATKVLKYFINMRGIEPSRFYVKGNADLRPRVPNDNSEQRAENRRVEIRLKKPAAGKL